MLASTQARDPTDGSKDQPVVGNYVILGPLGRGGMGHVFKARHRRLKRLVAIKMLPAAALDSKEAVARFEREVEAAGRLEHPNIVAAYDADEADGRHFLVMQYVEGIDLASMIAKLGPIGVGDALHCIIEAAQGLAYAHAQGLVHRDVKPGNLMLGTDGTLRILDMGVAWMLPSPGSSGDDATARPPFMGTADFLAPERIYNPNHADPRSDIYGLGCTLYYLIAGRPLYEARTVVEKIRAHSERPLPSLYDLRNDIPDALQPVFAKMVAKDPADRFQTAQEVIESLQACEIVYEESFAALRQAAFEPEDSDGPLGSPEDEFRIGPPQSPSRAVEKHPDNPTDTLVLPDAVPNNFFSRKRTWLLAGCIVLAALIMAVPVAQFLLRGDPRSTMAPGGNLDVETRERQAARWVLSVGGTLQIEAGDHWETVNELNELPPGPLRIATVQLGGKAEVSNAGLAHLADLRHLEMLWLGRTNVGDEGLAHVAGLSELRYLSLSETKLTDAGLRHLHGLTTLRSLRLAGTNLSDAGLQQLAALPELESLDVSNTAVSDVGLLELRSMPNLSELLLANTQVTNDGIRALNDMLPTCRVSR